MSKITCQICGAADIDVMKAHLEKNHPDVTIEDYQEQFPDDPIYSDRAIKRIEELKLAKQEKNDVGEEAVRVKKPLHEVFGIKETVSGVKSASGKPIPIEVMGEAPDGYADLVPEVDPNYIFNVDVLKTTVMGLECNINTYLVGHAGTGKSTMVEQVCAFTKRPMLRVQHTVNTEEAHVLGQYVVKDGATVWEPGPLQICMKLGITYLADEYDRAMPQVLSVYQPVLEGKPLVTKESPPEWRIVKPHPDFRIIATGNTNGAGDETGLYPSTALQDFANYERFGIMQMIDWMPEKQETGVVSAQAGIPVEDAKALVKYAQEIRKQVDAGSISSPISPRALINAGKIGLRVGNYNRGLQLSYMNRLGQTDREACYQLAQRHFG